MHDWAPLISRSGIGRTREENGGGDQVDRRLEHGEGREMKQLGWCQIFCVEPSFEVASTNVRAMGERS